MLQRYEKFLKEILDPKLEKYFEEQCEFVKCKESCSSCCEVGEYPFSRLELEYLMSGFVNLSFETKHIIKEEIKHLKREQPKMYNCPFLINKMCCVQIQRNSLQNTRTCLV